MGQSARLCPRPCLAPFLVLWALGWEFPFPCVPAQTWEECRDLSSAGSAPRDVLSPHLVPACPCRSVVVLARGRTRLCPMAMVCAESPGSTQPHLSPWCHE